MEVPKALILSSRKAGAEHRGWTSILFTLLESPPPLPGSGLLGQEAESSFRKYLPCLSGRDPSKSSRALSLRILGCLPQRPLRPLTPRFCTCPAKVPGCKEPVSQPWKAVYLSKLQYLYLTHEKELLPRGSIIWDTFGHLFSTGSNTEQVSLEC